MKRIHIVGSGPRTGTTLLMELMVNSFEIDQFSDHEDRIAKCPPKKSDIFLTKSPKDIVVIEPVLRLMSNLHVIYLMRDPRDMIVSMHAHNKELYYSNLEYWFNFLPFYYKLKNHKRFLQLRYEDLVANPDEVQDQIAQHIPYLKRKARFSDFYKTSTASSKTKEALGEIRPVNTNSIGNWRNHKERVLGQIQTYGSISDSLIEFGYEKDSSWEKELDGLTPDLRPSHESNFYKKKFIRKKLRFKYWRALRVWFFHSKLFLLFKKHV